MTLPVSMQICREAAGQLKAQGSLLKAMTPTVSMLNGKISNSTTNRNILTGPGIFPGTS